MAVSFQCMTKSTTIKKKKQVFLPYFQSDWLCAILYRNSGAATDNDWPSIKHQNYDNHFTWIITTNL